MADMSDDASRWQFQIDGRAAGPERKTWREAAQDAVNEGYATWATGRLSVYIDTNQGAVIMQFPVPAQEQIVSASM